MENKIDVVSISKLEGLNFDIPSYQRGYRWTKQQITDLLDDINEYDKEKDGDFYCLQPLVVKRKEENRYVVIDGQQRLTTIYLILDYIGNYPDMNIDKQFFLEYERENYIDEIKKVNTKELENYSLINDKWTQYVEIPSELHELDIDNIEFYHLFVSKSVIQDWFQEKTEEFIRNFKDKLLDNTKFIWYDIGDVDEHDLFKNLNSGKIALTNAELIKALFLNNTGIEIAGKELRQNLIAEEFDQIERTMREDDFWYFLAGNKQQISSCIDLLFELMLEISSDTELKKSKDNFKTFFYFKQLILHDNSGKRLSDSEIYRKTKEIWQNVQIYFYELEGWYKNPEIYNLVGYLRALKKSVKLTTIYDYYKKCSSKKDFINELKKECKSSIDYENDGYLKLEYGNEKVRNLLLLLNIATLLSKPDDKSKFSFKDYHKYNWDVEHISPQNPKKISDFLNKYENKEELPDDLKKYNSEIDDDKKRKIEKQYFAENSNVLENLTLLPEHVNRGIGNKFFFEKREALKKYFQQGSFIPPCSLNVFVKFYTRSPKQMLFWEANEMNDNYEYQNDGAEYLRAIQEVIKEFFNK